jgi:hypothetical protein
MITRGNPVAEASDPMTIGQQLEVLRIELGTVSTEMRSLVAKSTTAPQPSVQSTKWDAYENKLDRLDRRLTLLKSRFELMRKQGPGYQGSGEDPWRSRQRHASFDQQVAAVAAILNQCLDALALLIAPNRSGVYKGVSDLSGKIDDVIKLMKHDPRFSEVHHMHPSFSAPTTDVADAASISMYVHLALIVVMALKRAARAKAQARA